MVCDDFFGDISCDGIFDDSGDGIYGLDNFGLELRWNMQFDLLEEVFGSIEVIDN